MKKKIQLDGLQSNQDKLFLKDYIKDLNEMEKLDQIDDVRMDLLKNIWKMVSYSIKINSATLDYNGEKSKTNMNKYDIKSEHPLLRFDLKSLFSRMRIDKEGRKIAFKLKNLEVKQFTKKKSLNDLSINSNERKPPRSDIPLPPG